ncbi:zinc ABC transporter substrate-binding protein [Gymnodinialimonas hymeniacidonis]|uniref:zinc ABC transporter substrate-binding protein n=1 Tax=Gymnodinialimonas hymeniacidonis TaxID=3126508 RepID=UPI0034C6882D
MSRMRVSLSVGAMLMGGTAMADVPNVAVDIAPVHSLVARVMEGVGEPELVIPAGASPHEYNLRPSEARALQEADLVFWIGEGLTPWMEDAVETLAEGAAVTELLGAEGTVALEFREGALFEAHVHGDEDDQGDHGDHEDHDHEEHAEEDGHGDHDHDHEEHDHEEHAEDGDHDHEEHEHEEHGEEDGHEHEEHGHDEHGHEDHDHEEHADAHGHEGHDHGAFDPHAWLSPQNASAWLPIIAAQLSAADPENASTYFANAVEGQAELAALIADVSGILEPVQDKQFIVFHDAYQYFENDFGLSAAGAISLGDATDPSPARLAEIQGRIRDEGIDCVLAEPQFNPGLIETVLDGTEAGTAVIDPIGAELALGATLYPQLIHNMATTLAECG